MRRGRRIDHSWDIRKYKGDLALYAYCSCGFKYPCSSSKRKEDGTFSLEQEVTLLYHYCPNCGAHKIWYNKDIHKVDKFPYE